MEKQDTSVFPVYNEPEVRDSSEVWLIVYRSSGNFGEIFVFTNWKLYLCTGNQASRLIKAASESGQSQ